MVVSRILKVEEDGTLTLKLPALKGRRMVLVEEGQNLVLRPMHLLSKGELSAIARIGERWGVIRVEAGGESKA